MPLLLNIWNTLVQRFRGAGFPNIPPTTEDGMKLYNLIASGKTNVTSLEQAVGLSRTLKI
jgi:hypothetical protein